ncbi:hypothetical protein SS50377_25081 [Spironucleus salmonicida]|uniref:Uncharacterized protein n=1 Tax=Spironucleus salmonicida TaxID=348837 RepID=V6LGW6_9EUKA|nr:hypothetical protein SS50377_25081 [Spironucleus salmonicida]|eukprot:EST42951.1 Hypothetical protein SS50377_17398 [Spironucleus salmonicida]
MQMAPSKVLEQQLQLACQNINKLHPNSKSPNTEQAEPDQKMITNKLTKNIKQIELEGIQLHSEFTALKKQLKITEGNYQESLIESAKLRSQVHQLLKSEKELKNHLLQQKDTTIVLRENILSLQKANQCTLQKVMNYNTALAAFNANPRPA